MLALSLVAANALAGSWAESNDRDPMTGEKKCLALYYPVRPTSPMGFPYQDVVAGIAILRTGNGDESIRLVFNAQPNLVGGVLSNQYSLFDFRVKWEGGKYDGVVESYPFSIEWGGKVAVLENLYAPDNPRFFSHALESKSVLIEFDWYGEGKVYFRFPLAGFAGELDKIRHSCPA